MLMNDRALYLYLARIYYRHIAITHLRHRFPVPAIIFTEAKYKFLRYSLFFSFNAIIRTHRYEIRLDSVIRFDNSAVFTLRRNNIL